MATTLAVLIPLVPLTGCVAGGGVSAPRMSGSLEGDPANSDKPGRELRSLIARGWIADAASLYQAERRFFGAHRAEYRGELKLVARHMNRILKPGLVEAKRRLDGIAWPAPEDDWPAVRRTLGDARSTLARYDGYAVIGDLGFRTKAAGRLRRTLAELAGRIENDAGAAFESYDHFADTPFFAAYPVELDTGKFMNAHFPAVRVQLASADAVDLARFVDAYGEAGALGPAVFGEVGDFYLRALLDEYAEAGTLNLVSVRDAVEAARGLGHEPDAIPDLHIGLVEIRNDDGHVGAARVSTPPIVFDVPVDAIEAAPANALGNPVAETADILILLDPASEIVRRYTLGRDRVESSYQSGSYLAANPDFPLAVMRLRDAEAALAYAEAEREYEEELEDEARDDDLSFGEIVIGVLSDVVAEAITESIFGNREREALEAAERALARTPRFLRLPIYTDYAFERVALDVEHVVMIGYTVIDRINGTYARSAFDLGKRRAFTVVRGLREDDTRRSEHLANVESESDIDAWLDETVTIRLSDIIAHYEARAENLQPLPAPDTVRSELLAGD